MKPINTKIIITLLILGLIYPILSFPQDKKEPSITEKIVDQDKRTFILDLSSLVNPFDESTRLLYDGCVKDSAYIQNNTKVIGKIDFEDTKIRISLVPKTKADSQQELNLVENLVEDGSSPLREATIYEDTNNDPNLSPYKSTFVIELTFDEKPAIDIKFKGNSNILISYEDKETANTALANIFENPTSLKNGEQLYKLNKAIEESNSTPWGKTGRQVLDNYVIPMYESLSVKASDFWKEVKEYQKKNNDPFATAGFIMVATGKGFFNGAIQGAESIPSIFKNVGVCGYNAGKSIVEGDWEQTAKYATDGAVNTFLGWLFLDGTLAMGEGLASLTSNALQDTKSLLTDFSEGIKFSPPPAIVTNEGAVMAIPAIMGGDGAVTAVGRLYGNNLGKMAEGSLKMKITTSTKNKDGSIKIIKREIKPYAILKKGEKDTPIFIKLEDGTKIYGKLVEAVDKNRYFFIMTDDGRLRQIFYDQVKYLELRLLPQPLSENSILNIQLKNGSVRRIKYIDEDLYDVYIEVKGKRAKISKDSINLSKTEFLMKPITEGQHLFFFKNDGTLDYAEVTHASNQPGSTCIVAWKSTYKGGPLEYTTTTYEDLVEINLTYHETFYRFLEAERRLGTTEDCAGRVAVKEAEKAVFKLDCVSEKAKEAFWSKPEFNWNILKEELGFDKASAIYHKRLLNWHEEVILKNTNYKALYEEATEQIKRDSKPLNDLNIEQAIKSSAEKAGLKYPE